jgi:hypothetical protein
MGRPITFRADSETERMLRELRRRDKVSTSELMRDAIRTHWTVTNEENRPTSWEIYQDLYHLLPAPKEGEPLHDRARHVKQIVKEKLLAKRREGTL